jgi:hypothetical protein
MMPGFADGFASWRRVLASGGTASTRMVLFVNAAAEVAGYVGRGLDRAEAADALTELALAHGLVAHAGVDEVQAIIAEAFEAVERPPAEPEPWTLDRGRSPVGAGDRGQANGRDGQVAIGVNGTRKTLNVREPLGRNRARITERPWEIPKFAMRGELTVLVAPPGAGKTTLLQQIMHAASGGTPFAGFPITKPHKVMVFHWEDDEAEMDRKVQAIEDRMGVNPHPENLMTVYCGAADDDNDDDLILAQYDARADKFTATLGFEDVDALVGEWAPSIVAFDPLANTFEGPEGNELLKRMGRLMRKLARRRDVAVILILHSKKYAGAMAGDMDAARNAGTLVGRIRVGLTLFPMTEDEAKIHNITPARRRRFVRLDDGKQAYGSSDDTQWFEISEVALPIDDDRSISVGVFDPWEPVPILDGVSISSIHAILRDIDAGVIGDDGVPTGELYQPGSNSKSWAGNVVLKHIVGCPQARVRAILGRWKKEGLLKIVEFKNSNRVKREGLKSVSAKWPGTQT